VFRVGVERDLFVHAEEVKLADQCTVHRVQNIGMRRDRQL